MDETMETLLCKEIRTEFINLESMELGTEQYKATVDGLTKLMDRAIELEKSENEHQARLDAAKSEKIDRWIKNGLSLASMIGGFAVTIWGTKVCLKFEETGTVTTGPGRAFMNRLFKK